MHARPSGRLLRRTGDRPCTGVGRGWSQWREHPAFGPGGDGPAPEVRLWRTSHTGGHRFAPTALVLPSATLWAWADVDLLDRVVGAHGPLSEVVGRYRGCATLGPRPIRP